MNRCGVCGGTMRLQCEQCGWGGTWLDPVGDGQLACGQCGHTQPALCAYPEEHREVSRTQTLTPTQKLRAAADHIERVGLYQGGGFFDPAWRADQANAACCVAGALMVVGGSDKSTVQSLNERLEQLPEVADFVRRTGWNAPPGWALVYWSDHTPQAEVLKTLRRIAAEWEAAS